MAKTLKMTFGYDDSDFTRNYSFEIDDSLVSAAKDKIIGINTSLAAGTAGGLSSFFISDDGDNFVGITAAQVEETTVTYLDISGGASSVEEG